MTQVEELQLRIATLESEVIAVALIAGRIAAAARELGRDDLADEITAAARATRPIDLAMRALRAVDTRDAMACRLIETPAVTRLQIGRMPDSFAFVARSGAITLSGAVPLRWRSGIRRALEAVGLRVEVPRRNVRGVM